MLKDKVLHLNSAFTIKQDALPQTGNSTIESVFIEGYASTIDIDRQGDVVPKSVWEAGIQNYLKNPIILAQHDYDDPIGRMVDYKVDDRGLWVKARISSAAEECYGLIKDKVLTAFSIGFRVLDAEYNSAAEVFLIKELELVEISVVSVPCNQNTVFDLSKAFSDASEYSKFKQQFITNGTSAKTLEIPAEVTSTTQGKWKMDPKELEIMLANAAKNAAEQATKSLLAAQEVAAQEKVAAQKASAEFDARIKAAVQVQMGDSGAERLLAEMTKRLEDQAATNKSALEGLEANIREKAQELAAIQSSKMSFSDTKANEVSYADKEKAVILARITGKSIQDTKFGRQLIEKAGAHVPSATWELEVSMAMEAEVRRKLVVAPILRNVSMQTNVMTIPVNPEAGYATWVTNGQFATAASSGNTATHQLKEITLNAYKVATNEYMAYEEEEDSLIALMPIVRDAMVRRTARAIDKAFLLGAGTGSDPVKGLSAYAGVSNTTTTVAAGATMAKLRGLRKDLGALGLDPAEVTFIVNTDAYYNLLEDTTFQTMNQVGVQATLLTGQIGQIGNSPVLVSAELPAAVSGTNVAATLSNIGALAVYTPNFIVGNQRGLRMDTQELVETQRRVLVASLRTGMTQIATNLGSGVAALRYTA